ncbi:unnamed protein product [Linum tenue]|uniref:Uncharacterized protein n=1 Tax=Linum tenue TaxID=586396 RepID=A0AAV0MYJ3_9ROSI|nr:unnamed protein product [Linum tenue]
MASGREERRWVLFGRLKRAVSKLRVILKFDFHVWRLASSLLRSSSSIGPSRVISFGDRPGLTAAYEDYDEAAAADSDSGYWYSPPPPAAADASAAAPKKVELRRAISRRFSMEDDIDDRAEMFIANFRRQLQIERQISLDLKYCLEKT